MAKWTTLYKGCELLYYLILVIPFCLVAQVEAAYRVGVGIADVTGPIAEVVFIGYAKSQQKGSGLHLRQFARAFIIEDDSSNRMAFISVDAAMVGYGIKRQVLNNLENLFDKTYTEQNLIISASHTHSTPGGAMMDLLFDLTSYGFVRETFTALVEGIVNAIRKAHNSMQKAKIYINSGELLNSNINRSPLAYILNPAEERLEYEFDTDKEMVQLKFVSMVDQLLGSIQWFAVHPTSMNNTNTLVSSDNVGYASILLEKHVNKGSLPGKGKFVGAFASTNLGDVSPNIRGPHCLNTGDSCDDVTSSCDGNAKLCVASGPGKDMFESTKIIAERLFAKAVELLNDGKEREVKGSLKVGHQYVDMPNQVVEETLENGTVRELKGCVSAMGYSFAAGTTDGPGEFDFKQGTVSDNMLWNLVRNLLATPLPEDVSCHYPKPILLLTGRIKFPYQWQPQIVSTQVAILGDVVLAAVPGEFTTMAGRRMKRALQKVIKENVGTDDAKVIIAGLSNIYSDYVVTPEEYQLQRYEAASTIFGPQTLPIYIHVYSKLTDALLKNETFDVGPTPPDLSKNLISFVPPVIYDWSGFKLDFGDCVKQPPSTVSVGDTVVTSFIAGHPRNNVMHGKTFLTVEKMLTEDDWDIVATDANWETKFKWSRTSIIAGTSTAVVEWTVTKDVGPGTYRIRHYGNYKAVFGGISSYEGLTKNFRVL